VYACLAETIVLTLEGRFENFTVGRHIEWEKVHEIYKLGLKHGMRLAAISGVNGVFSDEDIAKVRRLALEARAERKSKPPQRAVAGRKNRCKNQTRHKTAGFFGFQATVPPFMMATCLPSTEHQTVNCPWHGPRFHAPSARWQQCSQVDPDLLQ
jgi:hypothetical protein